MHSPTSVALLFAALAVTTAVRAQTYFPPPTDPAGNPSTPQKVLLGQALFWDEQLSSSRTIACGTCHIFSRGGVDPRSAQATHPGPDGIYNTADDIHGSRGVVLQDAAGAYVPSALFGIRPQSTTRRAPSPINAAYETNLFWDGRATDQFVDPVSSAVLLAGNAALESQAASPPVSDVEMGHLGRSWTDVANDIANCTPLVLASNVPTALATFVYGQTYAMLFQQVFGSPGVSADRIAFAIAAYERTLIADQSPYDLYLAGVGTLSAQELSGLAAFQQLCMTCHRDLLPISHTNGPALNDFRRIGLRPDSEDPGRQGVTNDPNDLGKFKVPQLRNAALRAPYMHTGGLSSFFPVIDFYNRGGDFGPNIDPMVTAIANQIGPQMRADISDFLQSLTDPRVLLEQAPFDRPHLWSESNRVPTTFGVGGAGTGNFTPTNQVIPPPFLGNAKFMMAMDRALPGAPTFLLLDLVSSTTPTPVLGHNYYLGPNPNVLFLGLSLATGSNPGEGYSTLPVPIPPTPFLAGLPIFGQWLVIDPAGVSGLSSSNAFGLALF